MLGALGWIAALVLLTALLRTRPRMPRRTLPTNRTNLELRAGVEHIAYEFVALERAFQQVQDGRPDPRRFDLEAALLHARNLIDFFWAPVGRRRPHPDGIYAGHYDPVWTNGVGALPQRPNERYDAMSAQLAHISTRRIAVRGPRDLDGELDMIVGDLQVVWARWNAALNGSEWAALVDEAVRTWRDAP